MNPHCPAPQKPDWKPLLFWPVFFLRYLLLESWRPAGGFHVVFCPLDEKIPFLEGFLIPYCLWHVCMVGMHLWLWFRDGNTFRQYSWYLVLSMSVSTAVFLLWPSCQNLRPAVFPRDNLLTDGVAWLYRMDTSTNVFPSEHVIGAAGFLAAVLRSETVKIPGKLLLGLLSLLTAASTVFLKQHSLLDVAGAVPVSVMACWVSFSCREAGCKAFIWRGRPAA